MFQIEPETKIETWYNATPHEIVILSPDEEGDIEGYVSGRGTGPMKFKRVKVVPSSNNRATLVTDSKFRPQTKVVDDVLLIESQPWIGLNFDLGKVPGSTWKTQKGVEKADLVYLIVSLPVAEYVSRVKLQRPPPQRRCTPTVMLTPNTSTGSVRDVNGRIIGVTSMIAFGDFFFVEHEQTGSF